MKRLMAAFMVFVMVFSVPVVSVSAAYNKQNFVYHSLNDSFDSSFDSDIAIYGGCSDSIIIDFCNKFDVDNNYFIYFYNINYNESRIYFCSKDSFNFNRSDNLNLYFDKYIYFKGSSYSGNSFSSSDYNLVFSLDDSSHPICYYGGGSSTNISPVWFFTNLNFDKRVSSLDFSFSENFFESMDLSVINDTFTLSVDNTTDNYYNYMFYVSPSPASVSLQKSLTEAVYFMSSTQWCMKYTYKSTAITSSDLYDSVADWYIHSFGKDIFDVFGNAVDVAKTYYNSQGTGINYYQLSQQNNCPFYLIKPNDSRNHVIPYAALNLDLNTDYYVNIIYLDVTDRAVRPSGSPFSSDSEIRSNYSDYPIYDLNFITNYTVYDTIKFSVTNGNFSKDDKGLYGYNDIVKNSNTSSSTATIDSSDNSVSVNSSTNSYDSSVKTSYVNYGTIYHNCTFSYGSGGGSGSGGGNGVVAPSSPDFDFDKLTSGTGKFFDFIDFVIDHMPQEIIIMCTAAFAVCVYCRIWGR